MTTGDVKGGLRKLEQRLRLIRYPRDVNYSGLVKGDPAASLPIISYAFTCYSTNIAEILVSLDIELTAKSDLRFIDAVYKVLRDLFNYKPVLTKQQFLQCGFSERKIQIVCDIVDCVVRKHKELTNQNKVKCQSVKKMVPAKEHIETFYPEDTSVQSFLKTSTEAPVRKKPLVERHTGSSLYPQTLRDSSVPLVLNGDNVSLSDTEIEIHCEPVMTKEDSSQVELLKIQLAECQEKLQRLDWIEDKLQTLENSMKGKIIIDVTDWNNLLGRVLLLETNQVLQSKKRDLSTEFTAMSEERTSSRIANISSDFKAKADPPESHHQSSGYSSLLSADTSPIAININHSDLKVDLEETARQRIERITKIMEETSQLLKFSNSSS
ncbi:centrosomal protein of 44 kDa [Discoglossus pictus]